LQNRHHLTLGSPETGEALETYIFHELKTYQSYDNKSTTLHYWRNTSNFEVDFILNEETAIEVKAKKNISPRELKCLKALQKEQILKRYILVSLDPKARVIDGISILPWNKFLEQLWGGEYN
jgi:predicted AAA+ superfamily ATPase